MGYGNGIADPRLGHGRRPLAKVSGAKGRSRIQSVARCSSGVRFPSGRAGTGGVFRGQAKPRQCGYGREPGDTGAHARGAGSGAAVEVRVAHRRRAGQGAIDSGSGAIAGREKAGVFGAHASVRDGCSRRETWPDRHGRDARIRAVVVAGWRVSGVRDVDLQRGTNLEVADEWAVSAAGADAHAGVLFEPGLVAGRFEDCGAAGVHPGSGGSAGGLWRTGRNGSGVDPEGRRRGDADRTLARGWKAAFHHGQRSRVRLLSAGFAVVPLRWNRSPDAFEGGGKRPGAGRSAAAGRRSPDQSGWPPGAGVGGESVVSDGCAAAGRGSAHGESGDSFRAGKEAHGCRGR